MPQTRQHITDMSTHYRHINTTQTRQNTHQHNTLYHRYSNTTPTHQHGQVDTTLTHQHNTHISHHRNINMALMHQHRHINTNKSQTHQHGTDASTQTHQHNRHINTMHHTRTLSPLSSAFRKSVLTTQHMTEDLQLMQFVILAHNAEQIHAPVSHTSQLSGNGSA